MSLNKDIKLLQLVAEGNQEAFAQLYQIFNVKIYNIALNYTQNIQEAEEVTQDVFCKVYKHAAKFKGTSSLSTWMYRITVNTSLNYIKSRKKHSVLIFGSETKEKAHFDHPSVLLENKEQARMIYKEIDQLADSQKTAFILSFIEGLPRQEVADIMDLKLKAVESLLQRAKKKLRISLEKYYPYRRKKQ